MQILLSSQHVMASGFRAMVVGLLILASCPAKQPLVHNQVLTWFMGTSSDSVRCIAYTVLSNDLIWGSITLLGAGNDHVRAAFRARLAQGAVSCQLQSA